MITRRTTLSLLSGTVLASAFGLPAWSQGASGGTLNVILNPEPPMLVVGLNTQAPTLFAGGQIYESLLTYGFDLAPMPSLAREWTVSDDGLTYTFTLQDNVKWHDGTDFTADDVVFTGDVFLREAHPRWRLIATTYVDSITAPDAQTVVFTLKQPFSAFIMAFELSSFPIMPKHIYEGTDFRTNPANQTPIGTGPFKFQEWRRGSYVHLVRNDAYWREGQPHLNEIYFRVIPDAASRAVAFEQGTVDVLRGGDVEGFEVSRLAELPGVETTQQGWESYSPLVFIQWNLRKPPFDNVDVRRAMLHAMDRDFIAETIMFGQAKPATGAVASTTKYYDAAIPAYDHDMERARAILAESGVNPRDHEIEIMPIPYGSQWERLGEYVAQQLQDLGFRTRIRAVDAGGWSQAVADFDFHLSFNFTYQYGDPALGVARHYLSTNIIQGTPFGNNEGYESPEADALFAAGAAATTEEEAQAAYSAVQQKLHDDAPLGWLVELQYTTIWRDKVHDLVRTGIGLNDGMGPVTID